MDLVEQKAQRVQVVVHQDAKMECGIHQVHMEGLLCRKDSIVNVNVGLVTGLGRISCTKLHDSGIRLHLLLCCYWVIPFLQSDTPFLMFHILNFYLNADN